MLEVAVTLKLNWYGLLNSTLDSNQDLTDWFTIFTCHPMKQRPGFVQNFKLIQNINVAGFLNILQAREPPGSTWLRQWKHPKNLFEKRLVARDGQRAWMVSEAVLLLGLYQKLLEDGVVQVRRAHDVPPAPAAHADGHVPGGDVGRCRRGGFEVRLILPTL